ncbi:hypothetical protein GQ55_3G154900 [Panicum hallii var. hallii]|uniref:Uncharacterized protein n=1 Tax=Panicum hallii var. hallii TaxID=1504633 RepID=A0A2T7E9W1_9POAL|nr:hypothetical protein GQ55_3G154900 [Panicum hallii var. hallii]
MMSTRCFRGDRPTLTGLRIRRITGAFFDAAHFRRLLRDLRWADASSYVLGFIAVRDCSREADMLVVRILILRDMADLAAGWTQDIDALFRRLYASLQSHPDGAVRVFREEI